MKTSPAGYNNQLPSVTRYDGFDTSTAMLLCSVALGCIILHLVKKNYGNDWRRKLCLVAVQFFCMVSLFLLMMVLMGNSGVGQDWMCGSNALTNLCLGRVFEEETCPTLLMI